MRAFDQIVLSLIKSDFLIKSSENKMDEKESDCGDDYRLPFNFQQIKKKHKDCNTDPNSGKIYIVCMI